MTTAQLKREHAAMCRSHDRQIQAFIDDCRRAIDDLLTIGGSTNAAIVQAYREALAEAYHQQRQLKAL